MTSPTLVISGCIDEAARRRFESAWLASDPPVISDYLPDVADPRYPHTLLELAAIDLEFSWKTGRQSATVPAAGTGPLVEAYLELFPQLRQPELLRRLLIEENHVRRRHGVPPSADEYALRFPELGSALAEASDWCDDRAGLDWQPLTAGGQLDRYELRAEQGQGGFGAVWRAFDPKLQREVALKQLRRDLALSAEYRERFAAEARVTAQLEHPGVVPIYDLTALDGQQPHYTMRLLGGGTLADAIRRHHDQPLPAAQRAVERLRLLNTFLAVARTVAFAHTRGVVHRDLKPHNIMLGDFGETVVLDWGLARQRDSSSGRSTAGDAQASDGWQPGDGQQSGNGQQSPNGPPTPDGTPTGSTLRPHVTQPGTVLGTPAYMAPEQAQGRIDQVDQRSDIYALGVILAELLTGRLPARRAPRPQLAPAAVPRPLAAICCRALAVEPAARYQSVAELIQDLELYLADEPVSAYREPWTLRVARWLRRHRALVTTAAATGAVTLLALLIIVTLLTRSNRDLTQAQRTTQQQRSRAEDALRQAERNLAQQQVLLAYHEWQNHNVSRARELLAACPPTMRHWEWHYVDRLCELGSPQVLPGCQETIRHVAYSPDGTLIAAATNNGQVQLWDAATRQLRRELRHGVLVSCLAFSPDGTQLASSGASAPRRDAADVKVWSVATGELVRTLQGHTDWIYGVEFDPLGRWLATCGGDETIRLWDAGSGELRQTLEGHDDNVLKLAFSPDGRWLASGGRDRTVRIWDLESGQERRVLRGHESQVSCVAFSPDGTRIASASQDQTVRIWDAEGERPPRELRGHDHYVWSVSFSGDGRQLASGGFDRTVRVWDVATGESLAVLRGHQSHIRSVAFDPSGPRIVSGGEDREVRVWDTTTAQAARKLSGKNLRFHPGGLRVATYDDRFLAVWQLPAGEPVYRLDRFPDRLLSVAFDPPGNVLACGGTEGIVLRNAATGDELGRLDARPAHSLAFLTPERLAAGSNEGWVELWDLPQRKLLAARQAHTAPVSAVLPLAGGRRFLTASFDGTIRDWTADGVPLGALQGGGAPVSGLAASPDQRLVASAGYDGMVRVWNLADGEEIQRMNMGNVWVSSVAFSPDGSRIVSGSEEAVKFWEPASGREVFSVSGHQCVAAVSFSPDGSLLGLAGVHHDTRLWQARPLPAAEASPDPMTNGFAKGPDE
ncbi:MAG: protein kinase [Pirellulaceae bacterium]|nr:protein kinase [Pirellulaceae bacterium]